MDYNQELGKTIRNIRKSLNLSQNEFSDKLTVQTSRVNLSRIESGKQMPSAEFIKSVAETYNISPYDLLCIREKQEGISDKYISLSDGDRKMVDELINHFHNNYIASSKAKMREYNHSTLGEKVKNIRLEHKLSQKELCAMLDADISYASLSNIENGKNMPSADFIRAFCKTFDLSSDWLLGLE
jgi:transcriptional regulator with XRE-family HTH domain